MLNNLFIGIDLVEVSRFANIKNNKQFFKNIFTKTELRQCQKKPSPAQSLAARFAAKEAVKKTIKNNIEFNKIEIINNKDGAPKVNFLDKKIKNKYKSLISITHTKQFAQAICLTQTKKS